MIRPEPWATLFPAEPVRCGRPRPHRRHTFVTSPGSTVDHDCDGKPTSSTSLAELLARRPDLADLTATTRARALEVSCA